MSYQREPPQPQLSVFLASINDLAFPPRPPRLPANERVPLVVFLLRRITSDTLLPLVHPRATRLRCAVYKPHPTCNGTFFKLFPGKIRYIYHHAFCPWRPLVQLGSLSKRTSSRRASLEILSYDHLSTPTNDTFCRFRNKTIIRFSIFSRVQIMHVKSNENIIIVTFSKRQIYTILNIRGR